MKKVNLYALSTCPWCKKTKKFFTENNVKFDFINYDLADAATQKRIIADMERYGATGFPFVMIEDDTIEGYNPDRYKQLLGL
ncbi:MAG: glutaredoxin family protein [Deltaproteobacteria bacterium]|nr:glutaredoxin family protein [Deltaproteobacteria bacterium]